MVHLTTFFAVTGLILTFFAAPVMLSLKTLGNNEVILRNAFDKFYFWSFYRLIAGIIIRLFPHFCDGESIHHLFKFLHLKYKYEVINATG